MARDYTLITAVLTLVIRALYAYQRRMARRAGHRGATTSWLMEAPEATGAISDYEPVSLSREEMLRVLAELPPRDKHPKRQLVRACFAVMWATRATSLRRGTMARIRWEDLDLDAGT